MCVDGTECHTTLAAKKAARVGIPVYAIVEDSLEHWVNRRLGPVTSTVWRLVLFLFLANQGPVFGMFRQKMQS